MASAAEVPAPIQDGLRGFISTAPSSSWRTARRFARRQPVGAVALVVILTIVAMAIFADHLRTSDPREIGAGPFLQSPGWDHWFGTNRNGIDVWSRVLHGARPSLQVGLLAVTFGLGGGTLLGLMAGYYGGKLDFLVSRLAEFVISFPPIIVGIVVATAMQPGLRSVILSITIVLAAATTRIMRGAVLQEREQAYVQAALVMGASGPRLMFRHILPNVTPLGIVLASALLPSAILFESALTFLGFGLPPGDPSWGADLSGQSRTYFTVAPWLAIFPGLALSITILAFNLLGDSLRDVLDPRLRGSGI